MKTQRPGYILAGHKSSLKIGLDKSLSTSSLKLLDSDIVVTVNEITSLGEIKLGLCTPVMFSVNIQGETDSTVPDLNRLCLSRPVGTSVVIRKKCGVSNNAALTELKQNGIYIYNSTPSLQQAGCKTGAALIFYGNEEIWKVVRLELTLLRGIN